MSIGKRILPLSLLVIYIGVIIFLCFWNFDPAFISGQSSLWGLTDKDIHFIMFIPFVLLSVWSFRRSSWSGKQFMGFTLAMLCAAAAAAFGIEALQSLTEYRSADVYDALYGVGGAFAGTVPLLLASLAKTLHNRRIRK